MHQPRTSVAAIALAAPGRRAGTTAHCARDVSHCNPSSVAPTSLAAHHQGIAASGSETAASAAPASDSGTTTSENSGTATRFAGSDSALAKPNACTVAGSKARPSTAWAWTTATSLPGCERRQPAQSRYNARVVTARNEKTKDASTT